MLLGFAENVNNAGSRALGAGRLSTASSDVMAALPCGVATGGRVHEDGF